MAKSKATIKWLSEPEQDDYRAAQTFLSLIYEEQVAAAQVERLRGAPVSEFKAADVLRASGLSFPGSSDPLVEKQQKRSRRGKNSPPSF